MKKACAVLLALFAVASSAFGGKFLSISDIHFNPFADPALVAKLEAADVSQWDAIFASSTVTAFSTYGSDVNDPLLRSALAEMQKRLPSPAFVLISGDFLAHKFDKAYQQYATDKSPAAYSAFVTKTVAYVASALRKTYPGVRIYPTLGNNDSDCGEYARKYLKIAAAHWHTIIGTFAGHTHQDEFRVAAGNFIHVTPSLTPIFGNNPAFEIVDVGPRGNVAGYVAWHLPNMTLPWAREYSFDEAYAKSKYDTATLAAAIDTDPATREQYFNYYSSMSPKSTAAALAMWQGYWCGLEAMTGAAFTRCRCAPPKQ